MVDRENCNEIGSGSDAGGQLLSEWLTRQQLAEQLGVSVDTLAKWATRQIGPVHIRVGLRCYYRVQTVQEWMRAQEARAQRAYGGRV